MSEYIFTGLAPNTQKDDVELAWRLLVRPWSWFSSSAARELEAWFKQTLPTDYAFAFASGRGALCALLETFELQRKDEVLLQAYTCIAVPGAVIAAGGKPVYVDIEPDTLNMSPEDLERKISVNTRVLIIQHTFGAPAKLDALLAIAEKHHLFVIEDCAHTLGGKFGGRSLGAFGDAAIFSFGRDKAASSVFGGVAVTNDKIVAEKLEILRATAGRPGNFWVLQQLFHPIITRAIKATYDSGLGRVLLKLALSFGIISKSVYREEKAGGWLEFSGKSLPGALAKMAVHQLKKLATYNSHRKELAALYQKGLEGTSLEAQANPESEAALMRYTVFVGDGGKLRRFARARKVFLGDWYAQVLAPDGVELAKFGYQIGMCPVAEARARMSVNLPVSPDITPKMTQRIIELVKEFSDGN
ncbi:MAG: DegT/DnrJ/EryC1/StrS family aminotransferase [Patescibacteria group bacterium]|nr:DegT/DnrJ/EryC1/StrS family aminotransferase [Patescibacteria group bacterium]